MPAGAGRVPASAGGQGREREEHERDPLDERRQRPRASGEVVPAPDRQRDRESGEPADEGVVVASAGDVHGEHGVPADEGGGEGRSRSDARDRHDGDDDRDGGERLEEPRRDVRRVARHERDRLGEQRERGAVHRRPVAPVGAHVGGGGALGEVRRRIDVRVPAAFRPDPAVPPVRPGVRREEERRCERDELDRDGQRDDQSRRCDAATKERESRDVRDERGREEDREGPCRSLVGGPAVARDERRALLPGERARTGDQNEGGGSGREGALHAAIIADYGSSGCAGLEGGPPAPTPFDELALPPPPPGFAVPVAGAFPSSLCFSSSSSSGSAGVGGV